MQEYKGTIPPCGIYCGKCPNYEKGKCKGFEDGCKKRKCKSFYMCCIEKKGLKHCYECKTFPCARFRKFTETWLKYGQDLIKNQETIKEYGGDRLGDLLKE